MASLGNHPNIVPLIGACTTQEEHIYMVLKFCDKSSLHQYLLEDYSKLTKDQLSIVLCCSASAVAYLHSASIVHRDIAARNFLLSSPFSIYLADFGLSRLLPSNQSAQNTQNSLGPLRWMAPESLFHKTYSTKSDCYMYAMFLYEVLFRRVPFFETTNLLDVSELIAAGDRPPILDSSLNPTYVEIFTKCWSSDPSDRLSMEDISKIWTGMFSTMPSFRDRSVSSSAMVSPSDNIQYVQNPF